MLFFKKLLFLLGCAGPSLLRGLFSSCDEWGLLALVACRLLTAVPSLATEHGLWGTGFSSCSTWAQQLRFLGPGAQAQYLWCTGLVASWHVGSSGMRNPTPCLLHWQVDSLSLSHQGSPLYYFTRKFWLSGTVANHYENSSSPKGTGFYVEM